MIRPGSKVGPYYVTDRRHGRAHIVICTCGRERPMTQMELVTEKPCPHKGKKKVRHPIYMIWKGMKSRCYTKSDTSYKRYGAKGIKVDPEWHDYDRFFADIGYSWRTGLSLDRKKGDKNYGPGNCRWATVQEQNDNRAVNYKVEVDGKVMTLKRAVEHFGVVNYKTAQSRVVRSGWDPLKAASTPKYQPRRWMGD